MASTSASFAEVRQKVLATIAERNEELVELCAQLIRYPTENPPGPTEELAVFVRDWLAERGIESEIVRTGPGLASVLSTFNEDKGETLHFMYNGHLDVFPADDPDLWQVHPYEGLVQDGKIHGRGSADMKGGLAASLIAYALLYEHREQLPARVSFMAVADEETGGLLGTDWILENMPQWVPDVCIIGEPSSPKAVRIGEKGISWLRLRIDGRSYHGSLGTANNCILQMAEALLLLKDVTKLKGTAPEDLQHILSDPKEGHLKANPGREWIMEHATYGVGTIKGGIQVNIAPRTVEAEVDIRVPFGITPDEIVQWAKERFQAGGIEDVQVELVPWHSSANYTPPSHPLVQCIAQNARDLYGEEPDLTVTPTGTDGRHFRRRGIPTVIYGPSPHGVAGLDEFITTEDLLTVIKVQACSAIDYIAQTTKDGE